MQRRGTKIRDRTVDDNETMITRSEGQSSWPHLSVDVLALCNAHPRATWNEVGLP